MNTPSPVAPVCDAIPISRAWRRGHLASLAGLVLVIALLSVTFLVAGAARAATDPPSTGAGDIATSDSTAQTTPAAPAGSPTDGSAGSAGADSRSSAKSLMESDCVAQVRQSTGEQGEITVGDLRSVYAWAPGFLDGSQPSAQPVDTGDRLRGRQACRPA